MPRNITAATDSILHYNLMPAYGEYSLYLHQTEEGEMGRPCMGVMKNVWRILV
jgi:hypothetical protein